MFQDGRTKAMVYARSLNFEPLAILPQDMWRTICQHFGLYRFNFFDTLQTSACLSSTLGFVTGLSIIFMGSAGGVFSSLGLASVIPNNWGFLGGIVLLVGLFCVAITSTTLIPFIALRYYFSAVRCFSERRGSGGICQDVGAGAICSRKLMFP